MIVLACVSQNFVICIEMFGFAIAHHFVFSYKASFNRLALMTPLPVALRVTGTVYNFKLNFVY